MKRQFSNSRGDTKETDILRGQTKGRTDTTAIEKTGDEPESTSRVNARHFEWGHSDLDGTTAETAAIRKIFLTSQLPRTS